MSGSMLERLVVALERIADRYAPPRPPIKHSRFTVATTESFERGVEERSRRASAESEDDRIVLP